MDQKRIRRILYAKDVVNGHVEASMEEVLDVLADMLLIVEEFPTHPFHVKVEDPQDEHNYSSYFMGPWSLRSSEKLGTALDKLAREYGVRFLPIASATEAGVTVSGLKPERACQVAKKVIFKLRNEFADSSAVILQED